jgi:dUTPase
VQFVPYFKPMMNTVKEYTSKEELYKDTESVRGEGGFGSSGI